MELGRYDEKAAKRLAETQSTPEIVEQRREVLRMIAPRAGERVLDVGSGPGFLSAAIADAVGPSGSVSGVDISEPMLAMARALCGSKPWVDFRQGTATALPFADASFDVVVSTQVLEYVRDVDAALAEFRRVLRPGGRTAILDTDWDSVVWYSPDRARMSRILAAWDEHVEDAHLPTTLARRLRRAGFRVEVQQVIPVLNASYDAGNYSMRMIDRIASFVVGRHGITREETEAWAREIREAGEQGEYFFGVSRYLFMAIKPA